MWPAFIWRGLASRAILRGFDVLGAAWQTFFQPGANVVGNGGLPLTPQKFIAAAEKLKSDDMRRATVIALNRTADGARAEAVRRIRGIYKIRAKDVRNAFTIERAYLGRMGAVVRADGPRLNVINFNARPSTPGGKRPPRGVSVDIKGTRKVIPGSFVVGMGGSGYTGVFRRKGKSRFPIQAVNTVSVPGMFKGQIDAAFAAVAKERFQREFRSAIGTILRRRGG